MSNNWLQVRRRIVVLYLEKMHWDCASWPKDTMALLREKWKSFWKEIRTRGGIVEEVCQIVKNSHELFPTLYAYPFACDCSFSHQEVGSLTLESALDHVTWLVSEILANVMQAEAGKILQIGIALPTVLGYTVTTTIWISLGHLLDDERHMVQLLPSLPTASQTCVKLFMASEPQTNERA